MKIAYLNYSLDRGGATIAARRILESVTRQGASADFFANHVSMGMRSKLRENEYVASGRLARAGTFLRHAVDKSLALVEMGQINKPRSYGIIPSTWPERVNRHHPDVVHLHWINGGMLGIEDLRRFHAPIVWTFHDAWPVLGSSHYPENGTSSAVQGGVQLADLENSPAL